MRAWLFGGPADGKVLEIFPPGPRVYIPVRVPISSMMVATPQNSIFKKAAYDRCGGTPLFFFNEIETC